MKKPKMRTIQKAPKVGTLTRAQVRKAVRAVCKPDIVQIKNPKTGLYIKIDRGLGKIISHKKTKGKYKNVPVARKRCRSGV